MGFCFDIVLLFLRSLIIMCKKGRVFDVYKMIYGFGSIEMIFVESRVVEQGMEYGVPELNDGFYVDGSNGGNWAILMVDGWFNVFE